MRFAGGQILNSELPKEKGISPIIDSNLKAHRRWRPCEFQEIKGVRPLYPPFQPYLLVLDPLRDPSY